MDENAESDLSKGFIRQRRNLIGISFILFFYESSKIVLSTINVLGNPFNISDPSRVNYVLWFVWIYMLVRYYQFYRHTVGGKVHAAIESRMGYYVSSAALAKFKRSYQPDKFAPDIPLPHEISIDKDKTEIIIKEPHKWSLNVHIRVRHTSQQQYLGSGKKHGMFLDGYDLYKMRLKAYIYVAMHTPYATEYHLPFLIALVPVVYLFFV
jgi:hypothetical protein